MFLSMPDLQGSVSTCMIGSSAAWMDSRGNGNDDMGEEGVFLGPYCVVER